MNCPVHEQHHLVRSVRVLRRDCRGRKGKRAAAASAAHSTPAAATTAHPSSWILSLWQPHTFCSLCDRTREGGGSSIGNRLEEIPGEQVDARNARSEADAGAGAVTSEGVEGKSVAEALAAESQGSNAAEEIAKMILRAQNVNDASAPACEGPSADPRPLRVESPTPETVASAFQTTFGEVQVETPFADPAAAAARAAPATPTTAATPPTQPLSAPSPAATAPSTLLPPSATSPPKKSAVSAKDDFEPNLGELRAKLSDAREIVSSLTSRRKEAEASANINRPLEERNSPQPRSFLTATPNSLLHTFSGVFLSVNFLAFMIS